MPNRFLEAVMLRRADEQMQSRPASLVDYNKNVPRSRSYERHKCIVCDKVKPRGGFHVCSRCFNSRAVDARKALKERSLER